MKIKILDEFKKFVMRGNVVDLAVGIIIGGAFGRIVTSLVSDIIMPPIGLLIGGVNFTDLKITLKHAYAGADSVMNPAVTVNYGIFFLTLLDFLIVAFAIFMMIRLINKFSRKKEEAPAKPSEDTMLLTEIRDLLKEKS